ncbi:hypothetical protein MWU65_06740 [Cellulophaga sp. F20128]|uniref:hypothetical protein n=1 Tax=Cellulophaga sp. F20128 TaxID=2926413 RepID=UPI001FF23002|nr:hypothetical protein [Cellulophaga sp. F20128]MCK0156870.1 hypothetical protein [Cellulophaga sp. F20128]
MKKILLKFIVYSIVLLVSLELLVRVFHLHNERPERYADEYGVEKWVPNQAGYSVTGNRKQNVGEYRINDFGFNSVYNNYLPSKDSIEIAIVGDSFIEGFHQDYTNSISRKVEKKIPNVKVFEFGYAGYNLADQLNLMQAYNHLFKDIDRVVVYIRFTDDLITGEYKLSNRLSLNTPLNKLLKRSKLIVYAKDIGFFDPIKEKIAAVVNFSKGVSGDIHKKKNNDSLYLENFKKLVNFYNYNKEKNILLVDYSLCSQEFLNYLKVNDFRTIDFNADFKKDNIPKTLIYDQHWNDAGREIIADRIAEYIKNENLSIR